MGFVSESLASCLLSSLDRLLNCRQTTCNTIQIWGGLTCVLIVWGYSCCHRSLFCSQRQYFHHWLIHILVAVIYDEHLCWKPVWFMSSWQLTVSLGMKHRPRIISTGIQEIMSIFTFAGNIKCYSGDLLCEMLRQCFMLSSSEICDPTNNE